ncbi:putative regulator protein [compost metagenome]
MIDSLCLNLATKLKEAFPNEMPSISKMKYSLKFLMANILPLLLILLSSAMLNYFYEAMFVVLGFCGLRVVSGGKHLENADVCVVVSTLFIATVIFVSHLLSGSSYLSELLLSMNLISLLLVSIFAPSDISGFTKIKEENFKYLKIISLIIVIVAMLSKNIYLSFPIFLQSLSLVRINLKGGEKNEN